MLTSLNNLDFSLKIHIQRREQENTVRRELVKHKQCGIREPDKHLSSFCAAVQIRT